MALTWEGWTGTSSRTENRARSMNASRIMGKPMAANGYKKNFFYPEDEEAAGCSKIMAQSLQSSCVKSWKTVTSICNVLPMQTQFLATCYIQEQKTIMLCCINIITVPNWLYSKENIFNIPQLCVCVCVCVCIYIYIYRVYQNDWSGFNLPL